MKHSTDWHREIAEKNTVLQAQVGSGLHGVIVEGTDDRDEMGVCIEPSECVIGLSKFEQYQFRTQPEGVRSGHGDLDLTVYSLRKWARLAAKGNPTVLLLLFAPESEFVKITDIGRDLQARPEMFLSRDCGRAFIGYLTAQRDAMLGLKSPHTNRPELVEYFGFDTKFAYHALRLGIQGCELLSTGKITLPIPEPDRSFLYKVRTGYVPKNIVLDYMEDLRAELIQSTAKTYLPDECDLDVVNDWLRKTYINYWWVQNA